MPCDGRPLVLKAAFVSEESALRKDVGTEGLFLDKVIIYTMSGLVLSLRTILLNWLS